MDDETPVIEDNAGSDARMSWASRHPKFMILLIAGIFYIILFGMCGFVLVLLLRG
jgi:hypothetical protein